MCKHGEKAHLKDLLQTAEPEVGVVIHDSDEEQESEDEGLDVVENHEILEEEGVVVNEHAKRMSMKVIRNTTPTLITTVEPVYSGHH